MHYAPRLEQASRHTRYALNPKERTPVKCRLGCYLQAQKRDLGSAHSRQPVWTSSRIETLRPQTASHLQQHETVRLAEKNPKSNTSESGLQPYNPKRMLCTSANPYICIALNLGPEIYERPAEERPSRKAHNIASRVRGTSLDPNSTAKQIHLRHGQKLLASGMM